MLTPKEKAKELVEKYLYEVKGADRYNYNLESMNIYISKQCAQIAVDEILNSDLLTPQFKRHYVLGYTPAKSELEYWQKVKQEIENI